MMRSGKRADPEVGAEDLEDILEDDYFLLPDGPGFNEARVDIKILQQGFYWRRAALGYPSIRQSVTQ